MIGANLILGGVDFTGNHLYTVGPYGSMQKLPYLAMGEALDKHHTEMYVLYFVLLLC